MNKTHKIIPETLKLAPRFSVECGAHEKSSVAASVHWKDVDCKKCLLKGLAAPQSDDQEHFEPVAIQEWYDIGADLRVKIRKDFSTLIRKNKAQEERIKHLEGLLGECERFFENQTRDLEKLIQPERYLFEAKELLQKLKAAKEGK